MKQDKSANKLKKNNLLQRLWLWFRAPSHFAIGTLLGAGFIIGTLFLVIFNGSMAALNSESFCISCHEMRNTVYQEYMETVHYSNRSGMKVICSDCHVPKEFIPKMVRKIAATKELYGKMTGIIETPQKFESHRRAMADKEWARMKANDSQECRNCHDIDTMDLVAQKSVAATIHRQGFDNGQTCIDCHKGIAHRLPDMTGIEPGF